MISWIAVTGAVAAAPWEPGPWVRVDLPSPPRQVALAAWADRPVLFAGVGDSVSAFSAETGEAWGSVSAKGLRELLLTDLDGDARPELLLCTQEGVSLVRPALPLGGKAARLWSGDCEGLAAFASGSGWPSLAVVAEGVVARLDPGPSGLTAQVLAPGMGALAASGQQVVVWRPQEVVVFEGKARTTTSPPADLRRLAGGRGVAWAGPDWVGWMGQAPLPVSGTVASLVVGTEPGVLWVGTEDAVLRIDGTAVQRVPAGGEVARLAVADVDGDGCPEVAIASADLPRVAMARGVCVAQAGLPATAAIVPAPEVAAASTAPVSSDLASPDAAPPEPAPSVRASSVPAPDAVAAAASPTVPVRPSTYKSRLPSVLAEIRCDLLAGWAGGLWDSTVDGTQAWSEVGDDGDAGPRVESGPALGVLCGGGRSAWRWNLGLESVPYVRFEAREPNLVVDIGAEVSAGAISGGPLVEIGGVNWAAIGARARFVLVEGRYGRPVGTELRAVAVPGATAGVLATAHLSYGLGRYRPTRKEAW